MEHMARGYFLFVVRNVQLPRWVPWCAQLILLPLWLWLTYCVFLTERGRADLGIGNWILMSLVLAVVSYYLFLLGYRKLPAGLDDEC
ncbi:MAG: hypothetical protein AMS25_15255 [Gemmatimonas sp. SM23_52]|nr:MAG: hypothetical protein AMS25_15255 [Gemmatimonas sp. SM23_52]